ncbi:MAG TPA: glycosyltransferase family 2 protein [Flavisolibacter sp.]
MGQPSVAIVILNWNGKHHLQQFLPSVLATNYSNFRVIVADNGSSDDSIDYLRKAFPQVELIIFNENHGFAKGYNEALKELSADYYMLLNSDVEVESGWLQPMVDLLMKEEKAVACQPKILAYKDKHLFEYAGGAGGWLDLFGYPFARGRIFDICEVDTGQFDKTEEVFWASGAAMLIKSEVYHQLKGFDEYFFAHQEEIDLCWRIHLAGYRVFCCPEARIYHVGGGTLPRGNSKKTFLNFRNNQILLAKNLPWSEKWWKIPFRLFLDQVSAVKGLLSGDAGYFVAIFKAHLAYVNWCLFKPKKKPKHRRRMLKTLPGVYRGNIVWQHFALKKKFFRDITHTS